MVSTEKTFFSFLWVFIERFGYSIIGLASTLLLARLLTPYEFGLIGTVTIFISVSNMIVEAGFGAALVQKKDVNDRDYSTIFIFNILMSIALYIILFVIAPYIADFYTNDIYTKIIRVLGLVLLINALTLIHRTVLIRNLALKKHAIINLLALLLSVIIAVVMAYKGYGVWALVAQVVINSLLVSVFMFVTVTFVPKLIFDLKSFKELFSFGSRIIINAGLSTIYNDVFALIITKKYSTALTGLYSQSNKLVSFPTNIFSALYDNAGFPILSKIENPVEFKDMVANINRGVFSLSLPLLLIIPFQSENIILLALGKNWIDASNILSILSLSLLTSLISISSFSVLKALGRGKELLKYGVIKISIGFIVLFISIQISFNAIIYGIVLTNTLFSFIIFDLISKTTLYKWKDLMKDFLSLLVVVLLINLMVSLALSLFKIESSYLELFIYILLMLTLYTIYLFSFKRTMLNSLFKLFRK